MKNNIDVARIMAEITDEAQRRYSETVLSTELQGSKECGSVKIDENLYEVMNNRNNTIGQAARRLRSHDGIHWQTPNYEHKNRFLRLPLKFIAKVVSKLTRFIMFQQNDVNVTVAGALEQLEANMKDVININNQMAQVINSFQADIDKLASEKDVSAFNDKMYLDFEEKHRGSEEEIKCRLQYYIDKYIIKTIPVDAPGMVIDLGCGRGEWLSLLNDYGYKGVGIDLNEESLKRCEMQDIKAYRMDVISYLKTLPGNSVKLLTSFQLIEHLAFKDLVELFTEIGRVMRKDGIIIMETPNPSNLIVGANTFYLDPTHVRQIPPELLEFIAEESQLTDINIEYWQDTEIERWWSEIWTTDESGIEKSRKYQAIEEVMKKNFWCSTDYALVAKK